MGDGVVMSLQHIKRAERTATIVPPTSRVLSIASAEKAKSEALFSVSVFVGDNLFGDRFWVGRIACRQLSVSNELVPVLLWIFN
jgi:hypothetical protein